jgi:hypothetical protein
LPLDDDLRLEPDLDLDDDFFPSLERDVSEVPDELVVSESDDDDDDDDDEPSMLDWRRALRLWRRGADLLALCDDRYAGWATVFEERERTKSTTSAPMMSTATIEPAMMPARAPPERPSSEEVLEVLEAAGVATTAVETTPRLLRDVGTVVAEPRAATLAVADGSVTRTVMVVSLWSVRRLFFFGACGVCEGTKI